MILLFAAQEKPYEKAQGGIAKDFRTLGTICFVMIAFCSEVTYYVISSSVLLPQINRDLPCCVS